MPPTLVQRKAWPTQPPVQPLWLLPTTTEPSALTPEDPLLRSPGSTPSPTMPPALVQRKAFLSNKLEEKKLSPTITEPSALTPLAVLSTAPGRMPSDTMPPPAVQRNASVRTPPKTVLAKPLLPTTTEPSPVTP